MYAYPVVITADMHLRDSKPKCRTDDFYEAQMDKLRQVLEIVERYNAMWVDAGDFFHQARPSYKLISDVLDILTSFKQPVFSLCGNHDQPWHNMEKIQDSGIGVLHAAGAVVFLDDVPVKYGPFRIYGCPYGGEIPEAKKWAGMNILVYHGMVWPNRRGMIPGVEGILAKQMLHSHPEFNIIASGHNHQTFCAESKNRLLCNVGSLSRQTADQIGHRPCVLIVQGKEGGGFEWRLEHLKINKDAVSAKHLEEAAKKEEELNAFVEGLKNMEEASLSFKDNVDKVVRQAKPDKETVDKIMEAVYGAD